MHQIADFRSDTVTRPTKAMYEAMASAPLGDDVLGDDPTVHKLEALGAEMMGFEAALFCPSGTQANQIAFRVHGRPGDEVILEYHAHTFANESGALAALSGLQVRPLHGRRGMLETREVLEWIRGHNDHHARTSIIALENTHNSAGGAVLPQYHVQALSMAAHERGMIMHLDGARIANAAVASQTTIAELCQPFDSATLCLSKGLCAPAGSLVAGSKAFIREARRVRKQFGGTMRQSGILAACGIVSLTSMIDRLEEDHINCRKLAEGLAGIDGVEVDLQSVETNMVYFRIPGQSHNYEAIRRELAEQKVLALFLDAHSWRMVCHHDVDAEDVQRAIGVLAKVLSRYH